MYGRFLSILNTVSVITISRYFSYVGTTEVVVGVARAVPLFNTAISGSAFLQIAANSRIKCLSECSQRNCSSFNFGSGECHLHNTYLCDDGGQSLVSWSGFKYYDVEVGPMIPYADTYRNSPDCLTLGRCSPKCYTATTTTTTTPAPTTTTATTTSTTSTTTTTTPAPTTTTATTTSTTSTTTTTTLEPTTTTTTTPAPTTTTVTMAPTTTSTTPAPTTTTTTAAAPTTTTTTPAAPTTTATTPAPTTTTTTPAPTTTTTTAAAPTTTTTTPAPTTTTTTTPASTTTTTTTTTPAPTTTTTPPAATTTSGGGIGDIHWPCHPNGSCNDPLSDCRNIFICECVAGYSYNPATESCVTTCPSGFDNSFEKTSGYYVFSNNFAVYLSIFDIADCESICIADSSCASYEYDYMMFECHIAYVTEHGHETDWTSDPWFEYYQRNCL
ncbi:mucin-5AC-like [Mercenaria mercenaria]|uniref:mucin-5AC-like n=1 Tax=Mercenaria mercenaria TaxID=6596 RepID=UPI00234E7E0C|nr:mucin-5AC-like [Mercenaria mercenaria]